MEPTKDWSEKYKFSAAMGTLGREEVAICSRHLLEVSHCTKTTFDPFTGELAQHVPCVLYCVVR